MTEGGKDASRLGIAAGAMAAAALIVAAGIYLFSARADVRTLEGAELSPGDRSRVMRIYNEFETAEQIGEDNPLAGIEVVMGTIPKIEKMDGWKMECGVEFSKKSAPMLSAMRLLAIFHYRVGECEQAEKYREQLRDMMKDEYLIFPMRLVGPMTVMPPGGAYYSGAKKRNNELLEMGMDEEAKMCEGGTSEQNTGGESSE